MACLYYCAFGVNSRHSLSLRDGRSVNSNIAPITTSASSALSLFAVFAVVHQHTQTHKTLSVEDREIFWLLSAKVVVVQSARDGTANINLKCRQRKVRTPLAVAEAEAVRLRRETGVCCLTARKLEIERIPCKQTIVKLLSSKIKRKH
uniref:F-box only protein 31 n=1 Tax=Zeugodacus cucurbitae TaxID=28588 RepID=A0A0A1XJY4_ZEUCU